MPANHSQLANFIWSICNLLRGPYKRNEYRKVILPMTVLRRFDCLLAPTKAKALEEFKAVKAKPENIIRHKLQQVTGRPFYNLSKLDLPKLLNDPNQLAPNLNSYINAFSPNVRAIMERFAFDQQIARMAEKNLLYEVIKGFCKVDLSPPLKDGDSGVDKIQMGYAFEELIRIGAEQSNEEAGEHFTLREVIKLMVNLLLSPEKDLRRSHVVKTIYDPACGTGGMLSVSEQYIRRLNAEANPLLFCQDWNDEAWAVCKSDMFIKGEDADKITVERPLPLNFQASVERIKLLDDESGFRNLATSTKKNEEQRLKEIEAGKARQEAIRNLLRAFGQVNGQKLCKDRKAFLTDLRKLDRERDVHLGAGELKAVINALGERDETAEICRDRDGNPEPDADLRDTESVPLKESIAEYFKHEVLPHVPDAWIDESKTKIGYEIPLNRHFYRYEPPRGLEEIEGSIKKLEGEILALLKEVTS